MRNPVNKSTHDFLLRKKIKNSLDTNNWVSIITCTNSPDNLQNILANFNRQDFPKKELIVIINNNQINENEWKSKLSKYENINVFKLDENLSLGRCLNFGVKKAKYSIIAKFDDDDYYGPKYLSDSLKCLANADLVGKTTIFVYFVNNKTLAIKDSGFENQYVYFINGSTMIFRKSIFNKVCFRDISISEDVFFCKDCIENGIKVYSGNKYNVVYIRYPSINNHTWKISNEELFKLYCYPIGQIDDFKTYVDNVKGDIYDN